MICLLEGATTLLLAEVLIVVVVAYLVDWDRYIKECVDQVEEEWRQEEQHR